jgi:hypothetical protein
MGKSKKKYYDYMLSYSPYDNVKKYYPNMSFLDFMHKYNIGSQQNGLQIENKQNKRYCFVSKYEYGCGTAVLQDDLKR